jgi:hypothetical protein
MPVLLTSPSQPRPGTSVSWHPHTYDEAGAGYAVHVVQSRPHFVYARPRRFGIGLTVNPFLRLCAGAALCHLLVPSSRHRPAAGGILLPVEN